MFGLYMTKHALIVAFISLAANFLSGIVKAHAGHVQIRDFFSVCGIRYASERTTAGGAEQKQYTKRRNEFVFWHHKVKNMGKVRQR